MFIALVHGTIAHRYYVHGTIAYRNRCQILYNFLAASGIYLRIYPFHMTIN